MWNFAIIIVLFLAGYGPQANAQNVRPNNPLVGTWKLVPIPRASIRAAKSEELLVTFPLFCSFHGVVAVVACLPAGLMLQSIRAII
jgi:hypothetical protein